MRKGKYKQLFMIFVLGNVIPLAFSLFQPNYDPKLFLAIFNIIMMFVIFYYIIRDITGRL
ncbi:MAG: hypothetical protein APF76_11015 [Desulfitibacter sp. BRH_c19]|nr:MAG: hypothetical protein APF76_11015 [Desulfitibacter sp. BRH_c19]